MIKKNKKGSMTVEASFIMPLVIIVICIIYRMCIIHYQNVILSAEAMRVASRVGYYWESMNAPGIGAFETDGEISARNWINDSSFMEHNPYQSLTELVFDGEKKEKANNYAMAVTGKLPNVVGGTNKVETVTLNRDMGLLQNYVTVTVTRSSEDPAEWLYKMLGLSYEDKYTVTAKGIQNDTTEFIRNFSTLYDLIKGDLLDGE